MTFLGSTSRNGPQVLYLRGRASSGEVSLVSRHFRQSVPCLNVNVDKAVSGSPMYDRTLKELAYDPTLKELAYDDFRCYKLTIQYHIVSS